MAFVLAHLSDPHLAPLPRPRVDELIGKRITGYVNWRRHRRFVHERPVLDDLVTDLKAQKPDHIAVTGDIANIGLRREFENGRAWLESLGAPADVSVIPGNHDAYVRGALAIAAREWQANISSDDGATGFPYLRRRGPMALIGLSTGTPTAWGLATGKLGDRQLAALAALLDETEREQALRVVLIHHPPVSQTRWHKHLLDAAAFKRVIAAHGAELVLHGHDHLHMLNWLDGPAGLRVPAVGVPSASAAPGMARNGAAYNLYRIDGAPGHWQCDMISRGIGSGDTMVEQQRSRLSG
jgi:3',5'-cyclic AMP phosphodiesterase CpdA